MTIVNKRCNLCNRVLKFLFYGGPGMKLATVIPATCGTKTVCNSIGRSDAFWEYTDFDHGTDVTSDPTAPTKVVVFDLTTEVGFREMFSFRKPLHKLCLSQSQVLSFVKLNEPCIRQSEGGFFFLTRAGETLFPMRVIWGVCGLCYFQYSLEINCRWSPSYKPKVVIPAVS